MAKFKMSNLIGSLMLLSTCLIVVHSLQCHSCLTIDNNAACGDAGFNLTAIGNNETCDALTNCCEGQYCTKSKSITLGITTINRGCSDSAPRSAMATPECNYAETKVFGVNVKSWDCSCTGTANCNTGTTVAPSIIILIVAALII
ncbi:unnamed protein product [Owenia fusiformis]|uniref:Protein sleepless n=1 Tax=Owenia fusiformis TaxID=6347 RepID=A0A8S4QAP1_OWEFU|nr:unnamed protein product [Owenia fusiformis]